MTVNRALILIYGSALVLWVSLFGFSGQIMQLLG